jgi:hypothetical protein
VLGEKYEALPARPGGRISHGLPTKTAEHIVAVEENGYREDSYEGKGNELRHDD